MFCIDSVAAEYCAANVSPSEIVIGKEQAGQISDRLLNWYYVNRRKMPWRGDDTEIPRSAYGTWISEVMLQQTRVETVISYWNRWMKEFPDVPSLANATPEDVNRLWAGLGYYRRAQMLLQGANKVVADFGGVMPETVPELLSVPGIGPYTAGAIASIAYGKQEPLVDGNVIRVLSRLRALTLEVGGGAMERLCWKIAKELVPSKQPGDYNQALMELGATVCKPTSPSCGSCPLSDHCHALALSKLAESVDAADNNKVKRSKPEGNKTLDLFLKGGTPVTDIEDISQKSVEQKDYLFDTSLLPRSVTEFPRKVAKKKPKELVFAVCVVCAQDLSSSGKYHYLFVRRPSTGLLANQWEFPSLEIMSAAAENFKREVGLGNTNNKTEDIDEVEEIEGEEDYGTCPNNKTAMKIKLNSLKKKSDNDVIWKPENVFSGFPEYFAEKLHISWDSNRINTNDNTAFVRDVIKCEKGELSLWENGMDSSAATLLEIGSLQDFDPIVHIFSHQRHTMHIVVKDVVHLGGGGSLKQELQQKLKEEVKEESERVPVEYRWMTAEEITAAGITTGCKKILTEVTKRRAGTDNKRKNTSNQKSSPAIAQVATTAASSLTSGEESSSGTVTVDVQLSTPRNAFDLLKNAGVVKTASKRARK